MVNLIFKRWKDLAAYWCHTSAFQRQRKKYPLPICMSWGMRWALMLWIAMCRRTGLIILLFWGRYHSDCPTKPPEGCVAHCDEPEQDEAAQTLCSPGAVLSCTGFWRSEDSPRATALGAVGAGCARCAHLPQPGLAARSGSESRAPWEAAAKNFQSSFHYLLFRSSQLALLSNL